MLTINITKPCKINKLWIAFALGFVSLSVMATPGTPRIASIAINMRVKDFNSIDRYYSREINHIPIKLLGSTLDEVVIDAKVTIEGNYGTLIQKFVGELYFGVIPPGKEHVLTWVKDDQGGVSLQEGLMPIVRNINVRDSHTFSLADIFGHPISYSFTGKEPSGMYLVFALFMVNPENSAPLPTDWNPALKTDWWEGVSMVPLFYAP